MFNEFGFFVSTGSETIMSYTERKAPTSIQRTTGNGSIFYLSQTPKFREKEVVLRGGILAASSSDFSTKYASLKSAFDTPGFLELKCSELEMVIEVKLKQISNVRRLTSFQGVDKIVVSLDLVLRSKYDFTSYPIESNFFFKINSNLFTAGGENVFVN